MPALPPQHGDPASRRPRASRRSARRRALGALVVGSASVAALILTTVGAADAHHADVSVVCLAAPATIRITATAWDAPTAEGRVNHAIVITFDEQVVATKAFDAENNYTFTVDFVAPTTTGTHVVRATATRPWGPNETINDIGATREATIDLPCGPAVPAPTTTVVATTTSTTTTTAPPEVLGVTETRPPETAVPVEVLPRFAG